MFFFTKDTKILLFLAEQILFVSVCVCVCVCVLGGDL